MLEVMKKPPTDSVELSFFVPHTLVKKVRLFMEQEGISEHYYTVDELFPYTEEEKMCAYLRGARYREDLTQKQLSELTGIPVRHISEMENGKRPIGKKNATKLAEALNCNARILLSM